MLFPKFENRTIFNCPLKSYSYETTAVWAAATYFY